jgi:tRNA threonylcarbamoyladenosine biosynthesis protein TsaE
MDNTQTITSKTPQETQKLGEELATHLIRSQKEGTEVPHIVCLYGELGAGKTVFTQGFAKGLGLPSRLVSPTFIIVKRYSLKNDTQYFYHVDLYRLQKIEDIESLGLNEIFADKQAIVVVEWAERLGTIFPKERIDIRWAKVVDDTRTITISYVR